jgi:hypothetical protein
MRVKCSVCGLYRGAKPHTGALHRRIMAARKKISRRGRGKG